MAKLRIGLCGIMLESMVDSPFLTDEDILIRRGQSIIEDRFHTASGAIDRLLEEPDVEIVPLIFANAWPNGPISRKRYDSFKQETLGLIAAAGPLDGMLCINHSAMEIEDSTVHGDTDFLCAVRDAIGPSIPLAVAFDMHGQLTPRLLDAITVFSVLRTAPHVDQDQTGARAAEMLMQVIRKGLRPRKAMVRIPILMSGEKSTSVAEPGIELFARLWELDKRPGLMEANIFIGFGWNDRPWINLQAVAVAEADQTIATRTAQELADQIWAKRNEFQLRMAFADLDEGLRQARLHNCGALYLCDSGDNTSAGAGGDLTFALQAVLATEGLRDVVVPGIAAPGIVEQCFAAGVGGAVDLRLGEEHRSARKQVMAVRGTVVRLGDGPLNKSVAQAGSGTTAPSRWAAVRIGEVLATFHQSRVGIGSASDMAAYGLDGTSHNIYVVKVGYLLPGLALMAKADILLLTEGCASLDFTRRIYEQVERPIYPLDADVSFDAVQRTYAS